MIVLSKSEIEDIARDIVNYTNVINDVDSYNRQINHDKCVNWAINRIIETTAIPDISHLVNESPLQKLMKEEIKHHK